MHELLHPLTKNKKSLGRISFRRPGGPGPQPGRGAGMKFAPAKKNHRISCPNGSPALVFHEIFRNRCFMKNRCSTITPSPAIHLLHFIDLWHHRNVFGLQKILLAQTNVHDSINPTICDQKISIACRAFVRKITLALVLLYKHSALRVMCRSKRDAAEQ